MVDDLLHIQKAYEPVYLQARISESKICILIALPLVIMGISLEYFIYPSHLTHFLALRILWDSILMVAFLLHLQKSFDPYTRILTFSWLVSGQIIMCYMIFDTEGYLSGYYAGLNLSIVVYGAILTPKLFEIVAFSVLTCSIYIVACVMQPKFNLNELEILYNNICFIILTSILSISAAYLNYHRKFREFKLHFILEKKNKHLNETLNIIDMAPGNIYWTNENAIYQGCNKNNSDFLNLSNIEEIIGKTALDFSYMISRDAAENIYHNDLEIIKTGNEKTLEEEGFYEGKGHLTYLTKKRPIFNKKKEVIGMIGVSIDITHEKKARQLEETNQELRKYMSIIHDICSPLYSVSGIANLICQSDIPEEYRQLAKKIHQSVTMVTEMSSELLHISQLETGKTNLEKKKISISPILEEAIFLQEEFAEANEIHIITEYSGEKKYYIDSERKLLLHIFTNIISNAIKYSPANEGKRIWINIEEFDQKIIVCVKDEGYGIKDIHAAVEPFHTEETPRSEEMQKTGLGLYSAKRLVEKIHEGKLVIQSQKGKGTSIYCHFPKNMPK